MIKVIHDNDPDGFGAAWVVHKVHPDAQFIPSNPGKIGRDIAELIKEGDQVFILDLSLKADQIDYLDKLDAAITVIDHHASFDPVYSNGISTLGKKGEVFHNTQFATCQLTWDWLFPNTEVPQLIQYIQDRDLWRWVLPFSKPINAVIRATDMMFEAYDELAKRCEPPASIVTEGFAILKYESKLVDSILEQPIVGFDGIPLVNAPYMLASEVGHRLNKDYPLAGSYRCEGDYVVVSLRGKGAKDIAVKYGGGGHPEAAGFRLNNPYFLDRLLSEYYIRK